MKKFNLIDRNRDYGWSKVLITSTLCLGILYLPSEFIASKINDYQDDSNKSLLKSIKYSFIPPTLGSIILAYGLSNVKN